MAILLTALAVWALSGVTIAAILARHGHNFWLFALIGLGYGPFLVLIWLRAAKGQQSKTTVIRSNGSVHPDGWVDLLIGLDGTEAAIASTAQVVAMLGSAVGRVRLVSVLDHEISNAPDAFLTDDRRAEYLTEAADRLGCPQAEIVLLSGQPDKALAEHATEHGFDFLVVAHRSEIVTSSLRGSTVSRLARSADVPVLIGPPG